MIDSKTQTLLRPAHAFDLPVAAAWTLALAGSAALKLAYALDSANTRRIARREFAMRPRARVGPAKRVPADYLLPDSWRIR